MNKEPIHFVTTAYGSSYLGLLLVTVESIFISNKDSRITVYWQDINDSKIDNIKKTYNQIEFIKTNINFNSNPKKRISSKTILWEKAVRNIKSINI